jgi:hypothetical protein
MQTFISQQRILRRRIHPFVLNRKNPIYNKETEKLHTFSEFKKLTLEVKNIINFISPRALKLTEFPPHSRIFWNNTATEQKK